jgi:hypothetical protein
MTGQIAYAAAQAHIEDLRRQAAPRRDATASPMKRLLGALAVLVTRERDGAPAGRAGVPSPIRSPTAAAVARCAPHH